MLRVAITGGIACGKSTVGSFLRAKGIPVCEADELAHAVMRKGAGVYLKVMETFGRNIAGPDGEIDRATLGGIVFGAPGKLADLNSIVHPVVKRRWRAWLSGLGGNLRMAAVIVPLLYEIGDAGSWDRVICVGASEQYQRERLRERGLCDSGIGRRLASQMPVAEKMERADFVIENCGTIRLAKRQTARILKQLLESENA